MSPYFWNTNIFDLNFKWHTCFISEFSRHVTKICPSLRKSQTRIDICFSSYCWNSFIALRPSIKMYQWTIDNGVKSFHSPEGFCGKIQLLRPWNMRNDILHIIYNWLIEFILISKINWKCWRSKIERNPILCFPIIIE